MAGTSATCSWTPWPPGGGEVDRRVVGEVAQARTVGVHDVDLHIAVALALERDPRAVRRPAGPIVRGRSVGEVRNARAVGVHDVDLLVPVAGAAEEDFRPVRRPGHAE